MVRAVRQAIAALPDQQRAALILAKYHDTPYAEIAEILDVPIGTVMSRLHRGRKQLQKRLYDFAEQRRLLPEPTEATT